MSLVEQARDMGIAEALLESGLAKGLDLIIRYQEEESLPRAPAKFETASDVGLWLFQNPGTRESLELFHPYREQLETAYAELEDMLSPWELRKALLARQCKYCPLP
jgi:CRISPR/Cas system-associated exonuclease Cas4 (RecB family)